MSVDRKALLREYKERRPTMGVYRVRSTVTGNSLVAASKDVTAILNRHTSQLRMGAHPNRALQQDFSAHGQESFAFEVLDTLTPLDAPGYDPMDDLTALEDMWLDRLSLPPDLIHSINFRRKRI